MIDVIGRRMQPYEGAGPNQRREGAKRH